MAQLMPLPLIVSCFSKIQIGFFFLVPVHPGSPEQRAIKQVCVCVQCAPIINNSSRFETKTNKHAEKIFEITEGIDGVIESAFLNRQISCIYVYEISFV